MNDDDSQDNQTVDQATAVVQEATAAALNEAGVSSQGDNIRILADRISFHIFVAFIPAIIP